MCSLLKRLVMAALLLGALASTAAPALAAAPSNDTFAGAKLVEIGFSETVDTGEATADADDAQLSATCPAPAVEASVWYAIVGDGSQIAIDVGASSYSAGVIVATGSQGNLTTLTCGPAFVSFRSEPGVQYYVLAFDDQTDGGGNGGTLSIEFFESPLPDLAFSVDGYGRFDPRRGSVTLTGSYSCTEGADFSIFVDASQRRGRAGVTGFGDFQGQCDGTTQRWTVVVAPEKGKFTGGKLQTSSFGVASVPDFGVGYEIDQTVRLRGGRP